MHRNTSKQYSKRPWRTPSPQAHQILKSKYLTNPTSHDNHFNLNSHRNTTQVNEASSAQVNQENRANFKAHKYLLSKNSNDRQIAKYLHSKAQYKINGNEVKPIENDQDGNNEGESGDASANVNRNRSSKTLIQYISDENRQRKRSTNLRDQGRQNNLINQISKENCSNQNNCQFPKQNERVNQQPINHEIDELTMIDNYRNNKQSDIIIESYISYYTDQSNLGSKETSKVNNHDRGKQVFGKYNIPNSSSGGTKNKSNSKSRLLYRSGSRSSNDSLKCDYGLKYRNVLVPSATRVGNNNNSNDSTGPINKTNIKRNKTPTNQLNISSARFESRKDAQAGNQIQKQRQKLKEKSLNKQENGQQLMDRLILQNKNIKRINKQLSDLNAKLVQRASSLQKQIIFYKQQVDRVKRSMRQAQQGHLQQLSKCNEPMQQKKERKSRSNSDNRSVNGNSHSICYNTSVRQGDITIQQLNYYNEQIYRMKEDINRYQLIINKYRQREQENRQNKQEISNNNSRRVSIDQSPKPNSTHISNNSVPSNSSHQHISTKSNSNIGNDLYNNHAFVNNSVNPQNYKNFTSQLGPTFKSQDKNSQFHFNSIPSSVSSTLPINSPQTSKITPSTNTYNPSLCNTNMNMNKNTNKSSNLKTAECQQCLKSQKLILSLNNAIQNKMLQLGKKDTVIQSLIADLQKSEQQLKMFEKPKAVFKKMSLIMQSVNGQIIREKLKKANQKYFNIIANKATNR